MMAPLVDPAPQPAAVAAGVEVVGEGVAQHTLEAAHRDHLLHERWGAPARMVVHARHIRLPLALAHAAGLQSRPGHCALVLHQVAHRTRLPGGHGCAGEAHHTRLAGHTGAEGLVRSWGLGCRCQASQGAHEGPGDLHLEVPCLLA